MDSDFVQQLTAQRGFVVPDVYTRLHADGMLDWGQQGPHWQTQELPRLLPHPPLLMLSGAFEILDEKSILQELAGFYDGPRPWVRAEHRLLPFGGDGSGDKFCLYFDAADQGRVPVVHLWHDSDHCHFLAADLQDFIFMHMLSVGIDDPADAQAPSPFTQALMGGGLQLFLHSHRPYLKPAHAETLAQLYQRPFDQPGAYEGERRLLSVPEQDEWVERLAPCARRGERFNYRPPAPIERRTRHVGQLQLTLGQAPPAKTDAAHAPIQRLNWRSTLDAQGTATYTRKGHVFIGDPQWSNLEPPLQDRLGQVLTRFHTAHAVFIDETSGQAYPLAPPAHDR